MDDDKRRVYELYTLAEAQKAKINALGKKVEIAHRQRVKSVSSGVLIKVLFERIKKKCRNLIFHHQ